MDIVDREVEDLALASRTSIDDAEREGRQRQRVLLNAVALAEVRSLTWLKRREPASRADICQHVDRHWEARTLSVEWPERSGLGASEVREAADAGEQDLVWEHHCLVLPNSRGDLL